MTVRRVSNLRHVLGARATWATLLAWGTVAAGGCSSTARFASVPPITVAGDTLPSPVPRATSFGMAAYQYDLVVRRPAVRALDVSAAPPAQDVNSMDELPASSWYTPRLGYRPVSPTELVRGPEDAGPPQLPITVVQAKVGGGNPGFIVADARGHRYLTKFDPPEFPGVETTTAIIVNRLFWGFGYNVPEDYLLVFERDDLHIDPQGEVTAAGVDSILARVAQPTDGQYRATVSLFIGGIILGAVPDKGRRKDDLNDLIAHENRRVLRAMRVFGAFVNHTDLRIDNSLDTYVGEPGRGYVRHYMLDFGEALGGHASEHGWMWDGFRRYFDFGEAFTRMLTLGLVVEDWENLTYTQWPSVGAFEAELFDPATWKTVSAYEPMLFSQPDDDYWAVKVVGAVTREHLEALVRAAQYPEREAAEYVVETLMERRRKVLEYFLQEVSPIDPVAYEAGELQLRDMYRVLVGPASAPTAYDIRFYDDDGNEVAARRTVEAAGDAFSVPIPERALERGDGYMYVAVRARWGDRAAPRPAQFHLRRTADGTVKLMGVVH